MEENQRTASRSGKKRKRKSGDSGEKADLAKIEQNHLGKVQQRPAQEPVTEKQQPVTEKRQPTPLQQRKSQEGMPERPNCQHQTKSHKQPKSPGQSQSDKQPVAEKHPKSPRQSQSDQQPVAEKQPKPRRQSQSDKQPVAEKQSKSPRQSQSDKQPVAEKQSKSLRQSQSDKQPVAEKHPKSPRQSQSDQQPVAEKQPKSRRQSQSDKQPVAEKQSKSPRQSQSDKQPVAEKHPKSPRQSQSDQQPVAEKQPKSRRKSQSDKQPVAEKQSKSPRQSQSDKQPVAEKHPKSPRQSQSDQQPVAEKQPKSPRQSQSDKQPKPKKQSKSTKQTQFPQSATEDQPIKEAQPSPEKQPKAKKQSSAKKQLDKSESEARPSEPLTRQHSSNSEPKTVKSHSASSSEHLETREVDSKCVPSGDRPSIGTTSPNRSSECSTDTTCARNASAPIASAQDLKMTGSSEAKTEGRPGAEKSREEIEAERKLRKAAKLAKKGKKPDGEGKDVKQFVEAVKQVKIDEKKEKVSNAQPKVELRNLSEGESTEKIAPEGKSKAELRAERRAVQEAQRAAKAVAAAAGKDAKVAKQPQQQAATAKTPAEKAPAAASERTTAKTKIASEPKSTERRVKLFSHLYQCPFKSVSQSLKVNHPLYHPVIVRLGVQYTERVVLGSNARCVALLHALKQVVADYVTPPQKEFARGLESYLQQNVEFLQQCRPLAVSMTNALRHVKRQLTALPNNIKDSEARLKLQDSIDTYIKDQIETAAEAIGRMAKDKIADGDVILVYACSSLVLHALKITHEEGKKFSVVVVDSLPWLEGREMLRRLVALGIKCTYVHISAASFVMREVSKVLLGAHALLSNGYVMSRAGSSQIALLAHSYNVPVLVFCETHKFSERVQTDSFVYNELANPDELVGKRRNVEGLVNRTLPLESWRDLPYLTLLNLVYDVTPPDLVTAVVTELAILPCTSVPVILRIKPTEC